MNSSSLDYGAIQTQGLDHDRSAEDLGYSWPDGLAPMFHGSTTSLPQAAVIEHGHTPTGYTNDFSDPLSSHSYLQAFPNINATSTTSPEVLAAASTLISNGQPHAGNTYGYRIGPRPSMTHSQGFHNINSMSKGASAGYVGHPNTRLRNGDASWFVNHQPFNHGMSVPKNHAFYDNTLQRNMNAVNLRRPADLSFGSDISFFDHGFVAPPDQETEEEVTKTMLDKMDCLEPQISAASTRPPSPAVRRRKPPLSAASFESIRSPQDANAENSGMPHGAPIQQQSDPRVRKRRKHGLKTEAEEDSPTNSPEPRLKRPKSAVTRQSVTAQTSLANGTPPRNVRSRSGEQKSNRENLSESQKRTNHIASEQKRRDLIKQGFDDLCELIPELKGGGSSKSAMLAQAANWLEDLVRGNETLKRQLAEMDSISMFR